METFNIIVGIFSIISSIATIISLGYVISIKSEIKTNGNNNKSSNIFQSNKGKDNENNIYRREKD